jgi:hypothetical protein
MGKISIATVDEAPLVVTPRDGASGVETRALFRDARDPIHLHLHRLARDAVVRVGPKDTDSVAFVWSGAIEAGGRTLAAGSSLIVERGSSLEVRGNDEGSRLLVFSAARRSAELRPGGHIHLLPVERVPRVANLKGSRGAGGALHADGGCPTCEVWLHENFLQPVDEEPAGEKGVHSHSEDEVIFVTDGHMRLGARLYGAGSAVAIPAETFYSFGVGPDGLRFVNFRPARPKDIKFKGGATMDEVAFWRDQAGAPEYLPPISGSR